MPDDADDNAFNVKRVGFVHQDGRHGVISRMQLDHAGLAMVGLDRRFSVQERDDSLSVSSHILFLHDNHVARENAVVAHGCPLDAQGEGFSSSQHALRNLNALGLGDGFDGVAGGHNADEGNASGLCDGRLRFN